MIRFLWYFFYFSLDFWEIASITRPRRMRERDFATRPIPMRVTPLFSSAEGAGRVHAWLGG